MILITIITVIIVLVIYASFKLKKSKTDSTDNTASIGVNTDNSTNTQVNNSQVNVLPPAIITQQVVVVPSPETKDMNGTVNNTVQQGVTTPSILTQQPISQVVPSVVIPSKLSNTASFTFPNSTSKVYPGVWCYGNHYPTGIIQKTLKKPYAVEGSSFMLTHFFLDVPVLATGSTITCYISNAGSVISFSPIPLDSSYVGSFTVSLVPDSFSETNIKTEFKGKTKILYLGKQTDGKLLVKNIAIAGGYKVIVANMCQIYYERFHNLIFESNPYVLQTSPLVIGTSSGSVYVPSLTSVFPRGKVIIMHMVAASARKGHVYFTTSLDGKTPIKSFYCFLEMLDTPSKACEIAAVLKNGFSYDVIRNPTTAQKSPTQIGIFNMRISYIDLVRLPV